MTMYAKTMREAREEMLQSLNENNLEKMRKAAGGAKQTLKMKDGSIGVDSFSASAIMQIYDKINDKNKKTFENMMKNGKKADIVKLQKFALSKVNAEYVPKDFEEEVELDEAKYDLYHKDFSSAMQHAYKMAKKLHGITVDPKEIDDKVASGPKKPSEGKTNTYRLEGDKGAIQVQVYNKGGSKPFELNMYKEEVDLDEDIGALTFGGGIIAALLPVLFMAVREIIRGTPLESSIKKIVDKLKKNKNYKMSDSEKSDVKGFVSKVKKEKPSLLQKVMKQAKLNLLKDEVELDEGPMDGFLRLTFNNPADVKKAMKVSDTEFGKRHFNMDKARTRPEVDFEGDRDDLQRLKDALKSAGIKFKIDFEEKVGLDEAVKVGDTVKVKLNRKGKEYIEKGKVTKIEKDSIIVKHDFSRTPSRVSMKNIVKEEVELDEKKAVSESDQVSRDADKMTADAKVKVGGAVSGATAGLEKSLALKAQKNIDPADIDTSATDDDIKAADKNIMMQLRKSVSLRGQFPVEFLDKKKVKIPQKIAQAALTKYNSLKKPMDKEKFQSKIAKSHRDLLMALKEDIDEMKMTFGTKRIPAAMKKKGMDKVKTPGMAKDKSAGAYIGKMKKESTLERMNKKLQERQDG